MAIPKQARLAFKGTIFDTYQWDQKMYDGTTQVFERLKRADTTIVIPVMEDGSIVLQEEEQPDQPQFLTFCAGKLEEGENPKEGAERELLEETGLKGELTLWFSERPLMKIDWTVYVFVAKNCKKAAEQNLENGEKVNLLPISFDELLKKIHDPKFHNREVKIKILEAQIDPEKMKEIQKLLAI